MRKIGKNRTKSVNKLFEWIFFFGDLRTKTKKIDNTRWRQGLNEKVSIHVFFSISFPWSSTLDFKSIDLMLFCVSISQILVVKLNIFNHLHVNHKRKESKPDT